ncbi:MAG: sodium:calcium antiporter, partial [Roseovarius sp.]|uniref:sodium:calcium antiporter n=1 Tax=Roseovarius sp. TaxID=1486281 RepID=UPI001B71A6C3
MMPWLLSALGLVILLLAGDALVKGAVNLSLRVGIPALIVSLTVVAFGTSAPELLISVNAVLDDKPGLALGNVVGSNTANILLVLGIPAILSVLHTSTCRCSKSYLQMLAASVLFILLAFRGTFDWIAGLILLAALALMLADAFRDTMAHRRDAAITALSEADGIEDVEGADPNMPWWQIITFLVLGLVGLPLGADILVDNASILAQRYGVSEAVIGLTLVAVGTSLPELA